MKKKLQKTRLTSQIQNIIAEIHQQKKKKIAESPQKNRTKKDKEKCNRKRKIRKLENELEPRGFRPAWTT